MGQAHHQVASGGENEAKEQRRRAEGDARTIESDEHGGDVRGGAGEEVMRVEVDEREQNHRGVAAKAKGGDASLDLIGEVADDAELVEKFGHHHQRAEPDERIPRAFFTGDVAPVEHAADEEDGDAEEGSAGRVQFQRCHTAEAEGNIRPECEQEDEDADHPPFIAPHLAECSKFFAGEAGRVRRFLDFRRKEKVEQQRHQQDAGHAGDEHGNRPGGPVHVEMGTHDVIDGADHQRVRRSGGDKHPGGNGVGVEVHQREIAADFALRAFFRRGIEGGGDGLHDGVDDAAAARGVGGGYWC